MTIHFHRRHHVILAALLGSVCLVACQADPTAPDTAAPAASATPDASTPAPATPSSPPKASSPAPDTAPAQASTPKTDQAPASATPDLKDTTAPGAPPPGGDRTPGEFTPAQMQDAVRNFADQYRQTIAVACNQIIVETNDPELRRRTQQGKINGATAMYDIAVDPVPASALINAVVMVSLQANFIRMHGDEFFGGYKDLLQEKSDYLQEEAFRIAARIMTNDQRRDLLKLINEWSDANPDVREFWYVRIDDLPGVKDKVKVEDMLSIFLPRNFLNVFNPFAKSQESVSEAQALAERMSWLAPRLMILAQWRAESILYDALANPQVESALDLGQRFAKVAEDLPQTLDQQREALLKDLSDNQGNISTLLSDVEKITSDATVLLQSLDQITARVQDIYVRQLEVNANKAPKPAPTEPSKPFDINEYTAALRQLDEVVVNANTLLQNADTATATDALEARLNTVESTVTKLIAIAAAAALLVGLLIVLAIKFIPARR